MLKRRWAIGLGFAALLSAASARAADTPPPLDRARLTAFVDGAVREAIRRDHIAGVAVAVVDRSGVVMSRGYGVAALSPRRPVDADTLFRVGSISKTVIWISLMRLVQDGKVKLDDPIDKYLPPALRMPSEGFARPIRVRDLMTHSAGFEDSILQDFIVHDPQRLAPLDAFLGAHQLHRVREAGTLSVYSNYGASLGAAIVEHVSGQSWPDYAEQHVLRPLGMTSATYRQPYSGAIASARGLPAPMPAAVAARLASGFRFSDGALKPEPFEYINGDGAPGALSVSANDMALYMRALLDPTLLQTAGVLDEATALSMRSGLFGNAPQLASWRHGFMDFSASLGRPVFGHDGDLIYQHAVMDIYPGAGLAIFVAVSSPNGLPLLDALPINVFDEFVGPLAASPPRVADAKAEAARVAGAYQNLRRPAFRSERAFLRVIGGTEVKALANGDILVGEDRFYPIGGGLFARTDGPGRIAFGEAGGRMRLFDSVSAGPAERVGFFETAKWLGLILALAVFTAVWGAASFAFKLMRRDEPGRGSGLTLDALCLAWCAAFALLGVAIAPWIGDPNAVVFSYPGKLLPIALWGLLAAALATPLAALLAFGPLRPRDWSSWRWGKQIAAVSVFLGLGVTLFDWGFLGYTGW
ncbi:MAG TPA: serine hydrolase domain-containing protein [Caulobacteraceae bacterium]